MDTLNRAATKAVFKGIGDNKNYFIKNLPRWIGLIPYEIYVLPGMFLAIATMLWTGSITPLQFHLLPHWFAYSIFSYLKGIAKRERPGCRYPDMHIRNSPSHCKMARYLSFPSGHTGIAFALATSLTLSLKSGRKQGKMFGLIDFDNEIVQNITLAIAYVVAAGVSIHRVSYGYHFMGDVLVAAVLGCLIGYASYMVVENVRNKAYKCNDDDEMDELPEYPMVWKTAKYLGTALSAAAILHFFMYKFSKLADIQH